MTPREIAAWFDRYDISDVQPPYMGNYRPGFILCPYVPVQYCNPITVVESPFPTWLDKLKKWDYEAVVIEQEEKKHMTLLSELEERIVTRERERADLLQMVARLEGSMSGKTKVELGHVFDLLVIVQALIERK